MVYNFRFRNIEEYIGELTKMMSGPEIFMSDSSVEMSAYDELVDEMIEFYEVSGSTNE